MLSVVLKNNSSEFMFGQCYLQANDFIESNIYKPFVQQAKKKQHKTCVVSFLDNKGVEVINHERILRDPDIAQPTTCVKFPKSMVNFKLGLPISIKISNFNQFVNTLDLDAFL